MRVARQVLLLLALASCTGRTPRDPPPPVNDPGAADALPADAGRGDAGSGDAGSGDDAGEDAGLEDAGTDDAGGVPDAADVPDTGDDIEAGVLDDGGGVADDAGDEEDAGPTLGGFHDACGLPGDPPCRDDLACVGETECTGPNFAGDCDPAGVVPEAVCAEDEICFVYGYNDAPVMANTRCEHPCPSDMTQDAGCDAATTCVRTGCYPTQLICVDPGYVPHCEDGGEGEGEGEMPQVGGSPGGACRDEDDCGAERLCGAFNRCWTETCGDDDDCGDAGCATGTIGGRPSGAACTARVSSGGVCRGYSPELHVIELPCADGLTCLADAGVCG